MYGGEAFVREVMSLGYAPELAVANVSDDVESVLKVPWANASLAEILARSRFGMAMAAKSAMIATTIMISTKVKPFRLSILIISFNLPSGPGLSLKVLYPSGKAQVSKKVG